MWPTTFYLLGPQFWWGLKPYFVESWVIKSRGFLTLNRLILGVWSSYFTSMQYWCPLPVCKITAVISKYNSRYGDFSFAPENNKHLFNCECIGIVGDFNGCQFFWNGHFSSYTWSWKLIFCIQVGDTRTTCWESMGF